jgi:hypothetical protein
MHAAIQMQHHINAATALHDAIAGKLHSSTDWHSGAQHAAAQPAVMIATSFMW